MLDRMDRLATQYRTTRGSIFDIAMKALDKIASADKTTLYYRDKHGFQREAISSSTPSISATPTRMPFGGSRLPIQKGGFYGRKFYGWGRGNTST